MASHRPRNAGKRSAKKPWACPSRQRRRSGLLVRATRLPGASSISWRPEASLAWQRNFLWALGASELLVAGGRLKPMQLVHQLSSVSNCHLKSKASTCSRSSDSAQQHTHTQTSRCFFEHDEAEYLVPDLQALCVLALKLSSWASALLRASWLWRCNRLP